MATAIETLSYTAYKKACATLGVEPQPTYALFVKAVVEGGRMVQKQTFVPVLMFCHSFSDNNRPCSRLANHKYPCISDPSIAFQFDERDRKHA